MMGGGGGAPGGNPFDLSAMLNNPAMLQMATQMMSSPQMQQMCVVIVDCEETKLASFRMGNLMENMSSNSGGQGGQGGLNNLLNVGQQLAQAMQSSNPELVRFALTTTWRRLCYGRLSNCGSRWAAVRIRGRRMTITAMAQIHRRRVARAREICQLDRLPAKYFTKKISFIPFTVFVHGFDTSRLSNAAIHSNDA